MVKRKVSWTGWLAVIVSAVGLVVAPTAAADFWLSGDVYDNGILCVGNQTNMTGSYAGVTVSSKTNQAYRLPSYSCSYNRSVPYPFLAAMWQTYKYVWNPYGNWILCGQQGWNYGGGERMTVGRSISGCGSAWYYVQGGTYIQNGDTMYGGWLFPQSSQWFNF